MTTDQNSKRPRRIGLLSNVLSIAVIGMCGWLIWPQSLGGSVAYVDVNGHSMDGTYRTGDLVVVRRHAHYAVGDIVAYRIPSGEFGAGAQVIHRIIGGNSATGFTTQGDNKPLPDPWHPKTTDIVGRPWLHLAGAGTKVAALSRPIPLGLFCAVLTTA